MHELAAKFIEDYHSGKYGYSVRGENKAWMYYCSLKMETEEQLWYMRKCFEDNVVSGGYFGWVNKQGKIIFCEVGTHIFVAEHCFLIKENDFELEWAKVTRTTQDVDDALSYVMKPTELQRRRVKEMLDGKYNKND